MASNRVGFYFTLIALEHRTDKARVNFTIRIVAWWNPR